MIFSRHNKNDEWDVAIDTFERRESRSEQGTDKWLEKGKPEVFAERNAFYEKRSWHVFRAQIDHKLERTETRSRLNWTLVFSGLAFASSIAVIILVATNVQEVVPPAADSGIRSKGGETTGAPVLSAEPAQLLLFANGQAVQNGSAITVGSVLTFSVNTLTHDHVTVFGVEENGTITAYYPDQSGHSMLVGQGRGLRLPDQVTLDSSAGQERFFAVFSSSPLAWSDVQRAANDAWTASGGQLTDMGGPGLPDTQEASVWFDKQR